MAGVETGCSYKYKRGTYKDQCCGEKQVAGEQLCIGCIYKKAGVRSEKFTNLISYFGMVPFCNELYSHPKYYDPESPDKDLFLSRKYGYVMSYDGDKLHLKGMVIREPDEETEEEIDTCEYREATVEERDAAHEHDVL